MRLNEHIVFVCQKYLVCVLFHDISMISPLVHTCSYSWSFMISHVEVHCRCAERCWWLWWRHSHDEQLVHPHIFFLVIPWELFRPSIVWSWWNVLNAYWMLVFEISWDVLASYSSSSIICFTWRLWKWHFPSAGQPLLTSWWSRQFPPMFSGFFAWNNRNSSWKLAVGCR